MAIPSTVENSAAGILKFLGDTINLADKVWTPYAWQVSGAYATAYKNQQKILDDVKREKEAQRKADQATMAFFLSLLTVGVAGGIAGALARKALDDKDYQDAAKQVLQLAQRQAAAPLVDALSDDLSPDKPNAKVFAASDTDPSEYTARLFTGITTSVALLTKINYEVMYGENTDTVKYEGKSIKTRSGGVLSVEGLRCLTEAILDSSFIKDMPPTLSDKVLTRKASLALWIGWASARDVQYWKNEQLEQFDDCWEPVRKALILAGVPETICTLRPFRGYFPKPKDGLNFSGFIDWATGPNAIPVLFSTGLPRNAKGFEMVQKQMSM
jgi:hypothetical protein